MIDLVPDRKDYFRQTNNEEDPDISCQCTSCAAGLYVVHGGDITPLANLGGHKQPEDNLRYFTGHDPDVLAFCKKSHPGSTIHPSEWADVLVYAVNKIYGRKAVYFDGAITPSVMLDDLSKGLPLMVSLRFPKRGIAGHYVLVVGIDTENKWLVNDLYKNFLLGLPDGYHCAYSGEDWRVHSKGYGLRFVKREAL